MVLMRVLVSPSWTTSYDPTFFLRKWFQLRDPGQVGVGDAVGEDGTEEVLSGGAPCAEVPGGCGGLRVLVFKNKACLSGRHPPHPLGLPPMILPPYMCGQKSETQDMSMSVGVPQYVSKSLSKIGWRRRSCAVVLDGLWLGVYSKAGHGPDEGPGLSPLDYLR